MKTFRPVKFDGNEIVAQNNLLVESPRNLNLQEQKLFLFLISKINPQKFDQNLKFRISAKEFAKALEVTDTSNSYRYIRNLVRALQRKIVTLHRIEDGVETITDVALIPYAKYWSTLGYADIEINSVLHPYLLELNKEFTRYKLSNVVKLSSLYAIRLYEMLKKQEIIGKRIFSINDLRKKLNIPPNSLKLFKDFRVKVLEIAQREINQKTDLTIDYTFHKEGRKFANVEFDIESKSNSVSNKYSQTIELQKKQTDIAKKLLKYDFSINETLDINKTYPPEQIELALKAVSPLIKKGVTNKKAIVLKTIEKRCHLSFTRKVK